VADGEIDRAGDEAVAVRILVQRLGRLHVRAGGERHLRPQHDLAEVTAATRELYGLNAALPQTQTFGAQCLLARRLVERGVRFIELTCPSGAGDRWDQHQKLKEGHEKNSRFVDQPIAGLLKDLKSRGLLDSTLVVWGGEFGRTPFAQGKDGRDHNPFGFTVWLAGGGVKGGVVHGATDELGFHAVENRHYVTDIHATILHQLGLDPKRLEVPGRKRLEIDLGHPIHEILA